MHVALAPFRRGQLGPAHTFRKQVLTVISWDTENRVVSLDSPTFHVVAAGVEQGILLVVGLSLVRHVRHSYRAHSMVLIPDAKARWEPAPAVPGLQTAPGLIVNRCGADLFHANADHFADQVRELIEKAHTPVKWLVLEAEAISNVDLSAGQTVRKVLEELSGKGASVVFGRVNPDHLADMRRHRIAELTGEGDSSPRCTRRSRRSGPKARKFDLVRSTPQRVGVHGALDLEPAAGQADAYCR